MQTPPPTDPIRVPPVAEDRTPRTRRGPGLVALMLRWLLATVAVAALVVLAVEGYVVAREQRRQTCFASLAVDVQARQTLAGARGLTGAAAVGATAAIARGQARCRDA